MEPLSLSYTERAREVWNTVKKSAQEKGIDVWNTVKKGAQRGEIDAQIALIRTKIAAMKSSNPEKYKTKIEDLEKQIETLEEKRKHLNALLDVMELLHHRVLCLERETIGVSYKSTQFPGSRRFNVRPFEMAGGTYSTALENQMVRLIPHGESVLEICAGDGLYTKALRKSGISIIATDTNPKDEIVLREDATVSVRKRKHSILLVVHPMPYEDLFSKRDYITEALNKDTNAQTVILVLSAEIGDVSEYIERGFFEELLKSNLYVVEEYCDRGAGEVLYVLKRIPGHLNHETIKKGKYPSYDVNPLSTIPEETHDNYTVYELYEEEN